MYLTIADLALAVKKSENYVRQHINRKHLTVERRGRNVFVTLDEAERWARERGLSLALPAHASIPTGNMESRVARVTILSWHPENRNPVNLLTLIRHRRRESLARGQASPTEYGRVRSYCPAMRMNLKNFGFIMWTCRSKNVRT